MINIPKKYERYAVLLISTSLSMRKTFSSEICGYKNNFDVIDEIIYQMIGLLGSS